MNFILLRLLNKPKIQYIFDNANRPLNFTLKSCDLQGNRFSGYFQIFQHTAQK